jgi:hypothetical protein
MIFLLVFGFICIRIVSVSAAANQTIVNDQCPDHHFHPNVHVKCVYNKIDGWKGRPFLRIAARSTIDHKLAYTTGNTLFQHNQTTEYQYQMHSKYSPSQGLDYTVDFNIDVFSFPVNDHSDTKQFINVQSQNSEDYVDKLVGIAIDGVPIYTAVGPGGYDMLEPSGSFENVEPIKIDECGGTYGLTPQGIRYHYRTIPACVVNPLPPLDMWDESKWGSQIKQALYDENNYGFTERRKRYVTDSHDLLDNFKATPGEKSKQLVGWTNEGHPIYSPYNERGLLHENLDNCNGKFDSDGNYGYYTKPTFPYIQGCVGPGVFSLEEEVSTLEMLPADVHSNRRFNACPGGYVPSKDFTSNGCEPCPAGRFVSGTYEKAGQKISASNGCKSVCPLGHYCPQASSKPIKCPAGRYGSSMGLKSVDCSGICKEGFYCPTMSTRSDPYPCGRISHYCPKQSATRVLVDVGFYSIPEEYDDTQRIDQEQCGTGTYCIDGKRYPCPAGRFGTEVQLSHKNCTNHCPPGHYCPLSSPDPIKCPAGRYGSTISLITPECSGLCKPGYYCPQGSTKIDQVPCAPGRYGTESGLTSQECSPLCEGAGAGAPNTTSSAGTKFCETRHCAAGYYCPLASTLPTQNKCGGANVFCPPSSVVPTPVSTTPGYYTIGPLSKPENMQIVTDNSDFPEGRGPTQVQLQGEGDGGNVMMGDELIRYKEIQCEPGFYCIAGVRYRCPLGYYGATYGLNIATCSGKCDAGYLCPLNSTSPRQELCGVDASVYCPIGSWKSVVVPAGYYSVGDDHTTRESITACPPGMWCINGIKRKCAAGRYSVNGSPTEQCDGLCDKGYWCASGSNNKKENDCPAGRYGHLGMINAACKGSCRVGYYCPLNSVSPTQNECGGEYSYCPHGSGAPQPVSSGFFSSGGNITTRAAQTKCDTSNYWGTPTYTRVRTNVCPSTTVP